MKQFKGLRPNWDGILLWAVGIATLAFMIGHAIRIDAAIQRLGEI